MPNDSPDNDSDLLSMAKKDSKSIIGEYLHPVWILWVIIKWPVGVIGAAVLIGFTFEIIGVAISYWDMPGPEHSRLLVTQELNQLLINTEKQDAENIRNLSAIMFKKTTYFLLQWTQVDHAFDWLISVNQSLISTPAEVLLNTINLIILRAIVCIWYGATYFLVALAAVFNGIHTRYVRTQCAAPVSGKVFGAAARFAPFALLLPPMFYLSMPWTIDPSIVLGMPAIVFAAFLSLAIARYKPVI